MFNLDPLTGNYDIPVWEVKQNSYPNINAILEALGITSSAVSAHQNHFHVYLKPPTSKEIGTGHNLLTDATQSTLAATPASLAELQTAVQELLDYANNITTGDELMFTMDVPYIPVQDAPIVLAQTAAPAAGSTPQPDFILKDCQQTESTGDPRSAMRAVDPAYLLHNYLAPKYDIDLAAVKTALMEDTTHGKITTVVDNLGRTWYRYDPEPNYVGNDRAVFMAEFMGKRFKIVLNLVVSLVVDEHPLMDGEKPVCPPPTHQGQRQASVRFVRL